MMGHTPGPWRLLQAADGWWHLMANGLDVTAEKLRCTIPDANLIAAAPELLAALRAVSSRHSHIETADMPDWLQQVEDAISKAEGDSSDA